MFMGSMNVGEKADAEEIHFWYSWYFDVFHYMFSSMLNGEIVSMNTNGIPLGEYLKHWRDYL